jgi:hypothetical protein
MGLIQRLFKLDRRFLYFLIAAAVIIPLVRPLGLPTAVTPHAQHLFDAVDRISSGSKPVLLSMDYSPSVMPELQPMSMAILRHCFAKKVPIIVMTLDPNGVGLAEDAIRQAASEYPEIKEGVDYAFIGFKAGYSVVMIGIGQNFRATFPTDASGHPVEQVPVLANIKNYDDIALVITIAGSAIVENWIIYVNARYHATLGSGITAVSSADYYPFLQTGQLVGMLAGMKGGAEYEELLARHDYSHAPKRASQGMDAISSAHIIIILFIILGNISYFLGLRKKGRK